MAKKVITEEVAEQAEQAEQTEDTAAKEAAKAAKLAEKEAAKAEKAAAKEAAKAAKKALERNGEMPPKVGSKCALVWDTATQMSTELQAPVSGKALLEALSDVNAHTIKTQYARWRKYHGIKGRVVVEKTAEA